MTDLNRKHAAAREGDARLAERYRQRVAEVLRRYSPVVEVCSLDDFYADLTGVPLRVQQELADSTALASERSQHVERRLRGAFAHGGAAGDHQGEAGRHLRGAERART